MGAGVGLAAGGAAKGFGAGLDESQTIQQGKATAALGAGARQLVGAPPSDQPSGPLGALGNLFQGQQQASPQGASQAAPGVARSPLPQAQPPQTPQQTAPPSQVQPPQMQPRPPMTVPGLASAQPGVANTGAQQGQSPPAPPPAQAQMQMQMAPPGAAPRPQFQGGPPQMGQWDMPGLTQAIIKSRPNISDSELGGALIKGIPTLNAQGLQQFRGAAQQIARERADTGVFNADTARHREKRLSDQSTRKPIIDRANKEADDVLKTAYRKYAPVLNDLNATAADKKTAQAEIDKAEAQAKEIRDKGYAPPAEDNSGESDTGLPDEADAIAQAKEALQNKGVDKKAILERLQQYYPGVTEQDLQ